MDRRRVLDPNPSIRSGPTSTPDGRDRKGLAQHRIDRVCGRGISPSMSPPTAGSLCSSDPRKYVVDGQDLRSCRPSWAVDRSQAKRSAALAISGRLPQPRRQPDRHDRPVAPGLAGTASAPRTSATPRPPTHHDAAAASRPPPAPDGSSDVRSRMRTARVNRGSSGSRPDATRATASRSPALRRSWSPPTRSSRGSPRCPDP